MRLATLNVGGGFPARRGASEPDLAAIFEAISCSVARAFPGHRPRLVAEPGRALVSEAFTLATRVKAIRDNGDLFLNDGIYGALAEAPLLGVPERIETRTGAGVLRAGRAMPRIAFGPTCDSVDRLPNAIEVAADIAEGDYVMIAGMGAYSTATNTRFNGYGGVNTVTVERLSS